MRLSALAIVAVAVAACAAGLVAAQQPPNYGSNLYIKGVMKLPYAGTVTATRARRRRTHAAARRPPAAAAVMPESHRALRQPDHSDSASGTLLHVRA